METPPRSVQNVTVAASAVVVALLIYAGHTTGRGGELAPETPAVTAPDKTSFARIGVGACGDSKVEAAEPVVTTASANSCSAPIDDDMNLASLSVEETRNAAEATPYR